MSCSLTERGSDDVNSTTVSPGLDQPQSVVSQFAKQNSVVDLSKQLNMAVAPVIYLAKKDYDRKYVNQVSDKESVGGKDETAGRRSSDNIVRSSNRNSPIFNNNIEKKKQSVYSPQLKAEVVKFASKNSRDNTRKLYGIPDSTLTAWIAKARNQKGIETLDGGNDLSRKRGFCSGFGRLKGPQLSSQEGKAMIYDIPRIGMNQMECEEDKTASVGKQSGLESLVRGGSGFPVSKVRRFPDSFKENAVKFGELQGWAAASKKFGVYASTVYRWAKHHGKSIGKNVSDVYKENVLKHGLKHKSRTIASKKFGLAHWNVSYWGIKAGYRLNRRKLSTRSNSPLEPGLLIGSSKGASQNVATVRNTGDGLNPVGGESVNQSMVLSVREASNQPKTDQKLDRRDGLGVVSSTGLDLSDGMIQQVLVFAEKHGQVAAARQFDIPNHLVYKWTKKDRLGSANFNLNTVPLNLQLQIPRLKKRKYKTRKFGCDMCPKRYTSIYHLQHHYSGFHFKEQLQYLGLENPDSTITCKLCGKTSRNKVKFAIHMGSVHKKLGKFEMVTNVQSPLVTAQSPPLVESSSSVYDLAQNKCAACGAALAPDETLLEHVVSVHLTMEGLCDICGEDSADFVDHFKVHLNIGQNPDGLPVVLVKTEEPETNEIEACGTVGRWALNPFYSSC